jgi:hypothetical protein
VQPGGLADDQPARLRARLNTQAIAEEINHLFAETFARMSPPLRAGDLFRAFAQTPKTNDIL